MEKSKSNKLAQIIFEVFLVLSIIASIAMAGYLYDTNEELTSEIEKRDILIQNMGKSDSLTQLQKDTTAAVIERYTTTTTFSIDGKEVSTSYIADLVNQLSNEKSELESQLEFYTQRSAMYDSLSFVLKHMKDSMITYRHLFNYAKSFYGFDIRLDKNITIREFSRADSARLTYKYFADRIRRDSTNADTWIIRNCPN